MSTVRLILGDQLHSGHSWLEQVREEVVYVLMEVRQETDYVLHHAQKVIAIFAAMRAFAHALRERGHRVHYLHIQDADNRQSMPDNLKWLLQHYQASRFEWQAPDEWRLDQQLAEFARGLPIETAMADSEHFYTARDDAAQIFKGRGQWLMEHFYRTMRKRHHVLMSAPGKPVGGQWNFDHDNRKPWSGTPREPSDWRSRHDHRELWEQIVQAGVRTFGEAQAEDFRWPLNREEALEDLAEFVDQALPHFGDYQDALTTKGWRLFHSLLSFAMNTKMLTPMEVVQAAEMAYREERAPLAAVEGFIRQILGWREYVRGVYWSQMPGYVERNALGHTRDLPHWFWDGQTRMRCVSHAITQSLEQAYAHHIQRLMVIGNFALLAGLDPKQVHQWYLGIYIDAFEWVELPNTLGMSQFADGGKLATKPYVSSAAYIDRMSDYCSGCHYKRKERTGERACPFNALYWDFFARHAPALEHNQRLGMVYRNLQKMDPQVLQELREHAQQVQANLNAL